MGAAASVRLCVETTGFLVYPIYLYAAASVRLCVETSIGYFKKM